MKTKKGATRGRKTSRLRVKKETVKDLDSKAKSRGVKAGVILRTRELCTGDTCVTCTCITCLVCPMAR